MNFSRNPYFSVMGTPEKDTRCSPSVDTGRECGNTQRRRCARLRSGVLILPAVKHCPRQLWNPTNPSIVLIIFMITPNDPFSSTHIHVQRIGEPQWTCLHRPMGKTAKNQ
ncbi:hypothetical protein Y032_0266g685 [Ancylostoma ceylanicum]|uniref:Uncharacterized protein n=1 Tax=Ancylostoma ceylanicum TaxID=53326 RepID=A0A016S9A0_9BILA|nr:hypothetical protein Y032_0266g685 [Ancylostoma ceylanicum]